MTSNHHAPYVQGYRRATMAGIIRRKTVQSQSQYGLKSATRLHEAGIASNPESECRGEYVPRCCTHRPSRHGSR